MHARGVRVLAIIVGLAVLSGCTTTSAGDPGPAPTAGSESESPASSSAESDDLPADGAPKVTSPLDADIFEQDPCQALTQSQAEELNVLYPGKPFDRNFGKACEWLGPNKNGGNATIDFLSDDPRGMSSIYRSNNNGEFAFFEPLDPVSGHPRAAFGTTDTRETAGICAVAVGLTDELVFIAFLKLSRANLGQKDPCALASQVSEMMLTTMGAS
jgi:hypothetical protein